MKLGPLWIMFENFLESWPVKPKWVLLAVLIVVAIWAVVAALTKHRKILSPTTSITCTSMIRKLRIAWSVMWGMVCVFCIGIAVWLQNPVRVPVAPFFRQETMHSGI